MKPFIIAFVEIKYVFEKIKGPFYRTIMIGIIGKRGNLLNSYTA